MENKVIIPLLITGAMLSLAACGGNSFSGLSRAACNADHNCRHICADGSMVDPMFPNCDDPSRKHDRSPRPF